MDERRVWCAGVSGMSDKRKVEHMDSLGERNKVCFRLLGYGHTCVKFRVWPFPAETKLASKFGNLELPIQVFKYSLISCMCEPYRDWQQQAQVISGELTGLPTNSVHLQGWKRSDSPAEPSLSFCHLIHGVYIRTTNQSLNFSSVKAVFP